MRAFLKGSFHGCEAKKLRTVRTSRIELDSSKQVREDADSLIVPAILTRESILPFPDGKGFRPAKELNDAAWTLEGAWVVSLNHIETVFVTNRTDIRGKVESVKFSDKINGVLGDIRFFKSKCDKAFLADVKDSKLKDVSVAYFCEDVLVPGKFGDEPYDFVQQNFMFGHVAAGIPEGRCPSPFCGMAVDALLRPHRDPEETEEFVHVPVRDAGLFVTGSFRTITISEDEGIKAVVGKLKSDPKGSTVIQKYIFDKSKGWTLEKAEAWVKEHKDSMDAEWATEYINDLPDSAFAYVEEGGEKEDYEGKTVPRSLRHLPFKNAQGEIDHDHLVNALARVKQSGTMPEGGKAAAVEKLCAAVRSWNKDHPDSKIESDVCGTSDRVSCSTDSAFIEVERARALLSR
jgi:hypothetical protein